MQITDRIYGKIDIKSKVITDLIKSKPFQRLKKISQDGAPHYIQPARDVTRYEHSIGVWYLAYRYKRPIEEQIAALLHDIPHTAFSHVIDFVVKDKDHEFHDKFMKKIIINSEIPNILRENNISLKKVLAKENFDILENDLPDVSIDRLDYFMRDGYAIGFLPKNIIDMFLKEMKIVDEKIIFTNQRIAATFAILFVNFSRLIWLDPTSHGSFFLVAEAIKIGLDLGHISQEDFFTDDDTLYRKLENTGNKRIKGLLSRLKPGKEFIYAQKESAEFYGPNKPRYVNPLVRTNNGLERLTSIVPNLEYFFKEFTNNYKYIGVKQLQT